MKGLYNTEKHIFTSKSYAFSFGISIIIYTTTKNRVDDLNYFREEFVKIQMISK